MARRRFFVGEIESGRAQISGDDAHHLTRVLRAEAGQRYEISDGREVFLAEIVAVQKDRVSFEILEALPTVEPHLRASLYISLIRFERFEWMLEKATELGAVRMVAVQADRSDKGLELAALKRRERWNRIVREASEQSRRASVPVVSGPVRLKDVLEAGAEYRFALDEDPSAPSILKALPPTRSPGAEFSLLFGPEGGWTDRERADIGRAQWQAVSLGRNILRTETAVLAALAIVSAAWQSEA